MRPEGQDSTGFSKTSVDSQQRPSRTWHTALAGSSLTTGHQIEQHATPLATFYRKYLYSNTLRPQDTTRSGRLPIYMVPDPKLTTMNSRVPVALIKKSKKRLLKGN